MSIYILNCKYCDRKCLNRCSRCLRVGYCTKICQTLDWPSHKVVCLRNDTKADVASQGIKQDLDVTFQKDHETSTKPNNNEETGQSVCNNVRDMLGNPRPSPETSEDQLDIVKEKSSLNTQDVNTEHIDGITDVKHDNTEDCREFERKSDELNSQRTVLDTKATNNSEVFKENKANNDLQPNNATTEELNRKACGFCKSSGYSKKCSGCKETFYCSTKCQREDWNQHKTRCKKKDHGTSTKPKNNDKTGQSVFNNLRDVGHLRPSPQTSKDQLDIVKEKCSLNTQDFDTEHIDDITDVKHDYMGDCRKFERKSDESNSQKTDLDTKATNSSGEFKENKANYDLQSNNVITEECGFCKLSGCSKKCSRCKGTFYCSTKCQREDWNQHKTKCKKALSEEDERILKCWQEKEERVAEAIAMKEEIKSLQPHYYVTEFQTYTGPRERFNQTLTREQALFRLNPPEGSLEKAIRMTKSYFPEFEVVSAFDDILDEYLHSLFTLLDSWNNKYVLVAFMYRYHEHVMRHGVYLKDEHDKESKVEFYLDDFGDNPFPYFSYSQVKPGGYICLIAPVMHRFGDGTVGIRIDQPERVRVLDIDDVMRRTVEH